MTHARRLLPLIAVTACVVPNRDPNILGMPPFNQVSYRSRPEPGWQRVDRVTVTLRGEEANILNTIPALYERALSVARAAGVAQGESIYITGITLDAFTRRELFTVPYQECKTVYEVRSVTEQECRMVQGYGTTGSSYQCRPVPKTKTVPTQKCETRYRQELRDVLYETATGDVYA